MGIFRIFNKGKETNSDIEYRSRKQAEKHVRKMVKRSRKNKDFEKQKKKDYKVKRYKD